MASFKSSSSEKEFLLKRLQELIELEERQIRAEITKKNDVFVRQREKQNNEVKDLAKNQEKEINAHRKSFADEIEKTEQNYERKLRFLMNEIDFLEEELQNIASPLELLSSCVPESSSRGQSCQKCYLQQIILG